MSLNIPQVSMVLKVNHKIGKIAKGTKPMQAGFSLWRDDRTYSIVVNAMGYEGAAREAIMNSYKMDLQRAGLRVLRVNSVWHVMGTLDPDWRDKVKQPK